MRASIRSYEKTAVTDTVPEDGGRGCSLREREVFFRVLEAGKGSGGEQIRNAPVMP